MPTEKPCMKMIPRIYKWSFENASLFFFIKAQQQVFPTMTIDSVIKNYVRFMGMDYDDWDIESMRSTYTRMQNDFYGKNETAPQD
jgi:hypothetical protein